MKSITYSVIFSRVKPITHDQLLVSFVNLFVSNFVKGWGKDSRATGFLFKYKIKQKQTNKQKKKLPRRKKQNMARQDREYDMTATQW